MKAFYLYMMTNQSRVVLYTGITNSLTRRVWQHQSGQIEGFTKSYKVNRLVYYECFDDPRDAIAREKEIKAWRREKKNALVETKKSEVGGFIPDAFSTFQTFLACFSGYRQATMIEDNSATLRALRGPSLGSGCLA
jgi:putative endonuclease